MQTGGKGRKETGKEGEEFFEILKASHIQFHSNIFHMLIVNNNNDN